MQHRMGPLFDKWKKQGYFIKESHSGGRAIRVPFDYALDLRTYAAYEKIDLIKSDTLLIKGVSDDVVPLKSVEKFYESLTCPKSLKIIPNGDHSMRQENHLKLLEKYISETIENLKDMN